MSRPSNIEDLYPLSPLQQGLLFHSLYAPDSGAYVEQLVYPLGEDGADLPLLEQAFQSLLELHPILRTAFVWERKDQPLQVVLRRARLPQEALDWSDLPGRERRARWEHFLAADRRRGFDLSRPPLWRITLARLSGEELFLVLTYHHILLDGWSVSLVLRDLFAIVQGLRTGAEPRLEQRPPFRAYIDWLGRQDLAAAEAWWRQKLDGFTEPTPLPALARSVEGGEPDIDEIVLAFPAELTAALRAAAQRHRLTLNVLLQAAWGLLLGRSAGADDVVFGAVSLGRPDSLPGVHAMIGLLINTLPVRLRVEPGAPLLSWLARLQAESFELRRYEYTPLAQIQKWSSVPRGRSLFDSVLDFEVVPAGAGRSAEGAQPRFAESTHFPLTIDVKDAGDLALTCAFDRRRFERVHVLRLAGHLRNLLHEIAAAGPETLVVDLSLLGTAERHQLVREWNPGWPQPVAEPWVPRIFEGHAEQRPATVALVCGEERLTYGEANHRANLLAHRLLAAGAGPGETIAVCAERSLEMVLAVLAVLKTGGAYLPLDPDLPAERLAFLVRDAGASLILAQERLAERLPAGHRLVPLRLDGAAHGAPSGNPQVPVSAESLAYVIYTSGSTGQPKGVGVTQANLLRLFEATWPSYRFGAEDVWTLFHSYAFDFSVWEIWGALLYGGRLVIVPAAISRSPEDFYRLLLHEGVTVLNQTPSAFRQLIRAEETVGVSPDLALRWVIFGGEALELASLLPWFARHGDRRPRLVNMYGITETTVHVTYREVGLAEAEAGTGSVIGRPIPDLSLHLVGPSGDPLPIGVAGEICVGGRGLARGYLGRPDLTASRFVPDPFAESAGARLYRSGDLARRLPDGELEYLGRIDHQVKIRGFRIELGEIETALCRHPGVSEAVVVTRGDAQNKQLVGYVVPRGPEAPTTSALREWLGRGLPEYMIPALFVPLAAVPLNVNGKVDRKALPEPAGERPDLDQELVPPRTEAERRMAGIWAEVLGLDRVGIEDSFFSLGGDSILAIQVLARARQQGIQLSLPQLFQLETVGRIARELETGEAAPIEERPAVMPFSLVTAADRERLPAGVEDAYPVTQLQAGMLFHSEFDPAAALYHDVFSYHLHLALDAAVLRAATRDLVARHPVLRTSFDLINFSQPLQLVHREAEIPVHEEDLSALSHEAQERAVEEAILRERGSVFDWTRPPLLRFLAHRRGADTFQLSVVCHHAVLDGWSLATMLSELFQLYLAKSRNEPVESAPPAASFRESVALEIEALASAAAGDFWRRKLADAPRLLLPRWPVEERAAHGNVQIEVPSAVFVRLEEVARTLGVPLKSLVLAAHVRVLSLWGGQTDVVTGLVSNVRPETPDGERVLGLFLNTLPIRVAVAGGSWLDLIRASFAAESESLAFRRYPLAQIQRDTGGTPLFESTVNFMHFHVYEGAVSSKLELLGRKGFERNNFTLAVNFWVEPGAQRASLLLDHHPSQLGAAEVQAIGDSYARALAAIALDPERRHDADPLCAESATHRLIRELNDTRRAISAPEPVHLRFAAQALETPDAVALVGGERRLTYREADRLANRLAWRLAGQDLPAGSLIGVCLERSAEMVPALLGILKAGHAYVPLDPSHPAERLAAILEDARLPLVLTEEQAAESLPASPARQLLLRDALATADPREEAAPALPAAPEALAYAIFTSGSTGRPKGVQVPHGAFASFLASMRERPGIGPADRLVAVTTLSFDIAGLELFLPLIAGAQVIVASREEAADGERLRALLERSDATLLQATPATWYLLLEAGWRGGSGFKALCGGEAVPPQLAARLLAVCGQLWNMYGPTETTIWSAVERVSPGSGDGPVPLGRPIAETQLHVLSHQFQPAPVLTPGELFIGGAGCAWGYIHRPDLTAERFLPDPFSGDPGARLYGTGDLARSLPDGRVEYLGRADHQVKLRGFRIELGEIEAALTGHPAVERAVAMVREDRPSDKRLVAYVVFRTEAEIDPAEIREHVRQRLPEYMIPSAWMVLPELPLTPNGKVDRKALPVPDAAQTAPRATAAARTPTEALVALIWEKVLGRQGVETGESFLALGGHSLLASQVLARIRETFRVDLPLRNLFEEPTVQGMARRVDMALRGERGLEMPPLVPIPRDREFPLSFAQERLWFMDQLEPGSPAYNILQALRIAGPLQEGSLEAALNEMVRRHETLRTCFPPGGDGLARQLIRPAAPLALPVCDLGALPADAREGEAQRILRDEQRRGFDLATGPLLRVVLLRLAATERIVVLNVHHIISDEWSMGVLVREIGAAYEAFSAVRPSPLPPLPIQYADFSAWQRSWLQDGVLEAQIAYWRRALAGAPDVLDLPADRPRPPAPTFHGADVYLGLPSDLTRRLREISAANGATLFMGLLAGFQILLQRATGHDDVVVGTDVANRNVAEIEGLIGFFINHIVLRTNLEGNPPFTEVLRRVREVTLAGYTHQDLPFDTLVRALNVPRDASRAPLFQILFVLQNVPRSPVHLSTVTLEPIELAGGGSKFDMGLFLAETPDGLIGKWSYSTDLFDASTIERMARHFEQLLQSIADSPEAPISTLEMLTAAEREARASRARERHESRALGLRKAAARGRGERVDAG
jgi:amino acid adenylation domain-containing protein